MNVELNHVSPVRAANVVAILYAAIMLIFTLPLLGLISMMPMPQGQDAEQAEATLSVFRWLMLAYPIFGAIFGWVGGLTSAWIYNQIAGRLGGLKFRFTTDTATGAAHAA